MKRIEGSLWRGVVPVFLGFAMFFVLLSEVRAEEGQEETQEDREIRLAVKLYEDMRLIVAAVEEYRAQHGAPPASVADLLAVGGLEAIPDYGGELGPGAYQIQLGYANMDGQGERDDAIISGERVPLGVCAEFNKRYAPPPLDDGTVFDSQAVNDKYPGEAIGREAKVYAIKWQSADTVCEINWVIDYR